MRPNDEFTAAARDFGSKAATTLEFAAWSQLGGLGFQFGMCSK